MKRDKDTQQFGPPRIDSRVTDPAALKYQRDMEERGKLGGGPSPPIPRLDMPHQEGLTMADQARAAAAPPPGLIEPSVFTPRPQQSEMSRPPANILPGDVLPEAARQD